MKLQKLYSKFDRRCKSYSARLLEISNNKPHLSDWEFNYLTEVLISDIWQTWCSFCRELVFSSCRGTRARNGDFIAKRVGNNSWKRLGYEASQVAKNQAIAANGHLNFAIRKELTWGDIHKLLLVINHLSPGNKNHILSTIGSFTNFKHLQQLRNACAHKNIETISDINSLKTHYHFTKLACAPQLAWAFCLSENITALELWLFEMNLIADIVTSKS